MFEHFHQRAEVRNHVRYGSNETERIQKADHRGMVDGSIPDGRTRQPVTLEPDSVDGGIENPVVSGEDFTKRRA